MSPLPNPDRRALLDLARRAVREAVLHGRLIDLPSVSGQLAVSSSVFVTLHCDRRLRGCIGQIQPSDLLPHAVIRCAISAAREDPRFRPISAEELDRFEIEISVLSPPETISPEEIDRIEIGRHGVLVTRTNHQGLLLPQVAVERAWSRERFLEETCAKAGLDRDAWRDPSTRLEVFTAEVFSDATVPAGPAA